MSEPQFMTLRQVIDHFNGGIEEAENSVVLRDPASFKWSSAWLSTNYCMLLLG